ncbi:sugar porter family MFS transporter [Sedimentisphaera salicampi]|uniref:D-xylose transporter n=1 Tax=Sedimentisphaera salicampi TaxID=1941349 RepID=A0A1W6LQ20_9BACT|nr:sugar porter family MFS transporter [Sedimentisphaera salicampi]ARN57856.1 D-xylose transporter [Sedimentisphaera salicampi]
MGEEKNSNLSKSYLLGISLAAALGGLLFGYDLVVIGGAKEFYELTFGLSSPVIKGWAVSSCIVGCIVGAFFVGKPADLFGRKMMLSIAAILFLISAVGSGYAPSFLQFIIYRIIGGIGMGMASTISPMYISELSPESIRGRFVSLQQLNIVIGILLAQLVNYLILKSHPIPEDVSGAALLDTWNGQTGWRLMFLAEGFWALLFFFCMLFVPHSPRWLCKVEREEEAGNVLRRIGGEDYSKMYLADIKDSLKGGHHINEFAEILKPKVAKIVVVGIFIAIFSQWCGINVIFNYAHDIFKAAGYNVSGVLFNLLIVGITNFLFTIVAMVSIDKLGRKKLILAGAVTLGVSYTLLGVCFNIGSQGIHVLGLVLLSIAFFASSIGPVTWVLLSEIFPNKIRGLATSIAVFAMWIANFLLALTFPSLISSLDFDKTFWLYASICFLGAVFIKLCVPETKGKTLEQIEREITG